MFVVQPSLAGSTDVAVAIGIRTCGVTAAPTTCEGIVTTNNIGTPLFQGLYEPVLVPGSSRSDLVQNFTVTIPEDFPLGSAVISVAHFALIIVSIIFRVTYRFTYMG